MDQTGTDNLGWEIAETAHAVRRAYERRAVLAGVTRAQWRVLKWLAREPGLRQVDLAERLDVEPITLCRILDRLEGNGLVERHRDPLDRRAWNLELTDSAQPILAQLKIIATELSADAFAGLDPDAVAILRAQLAAIRQNLSALEGANKVTA